MRVRVGDVWRKNGPCGWWRVRRVLMPGYKGYDGGLPGVSVGVSTGNGGWTRVTWFVVAGSASVFVRRAREGHRRLVRRTP